MVPRAARVHHRSRTTARPSRRGGRSGRSDKLPGWLLVGATFTLILAVGFICVYKLLIPALVVPANQANRFIVTAGQANAEGNHVLLVSVNHQSQTELAWLNAAEKITIPGGYGEYELRSVVPLLALESPPVDSLAAGLTHGLGAVITQVLVVPSWADLPENIETLPAAEQQRLLSKFFLQMAFRQLPKIDQTRQMAGLHVLVSRAGQMSDQESIPVLSPQDLARYTQEHPLVSEQIAQACPLAIMNTTDQSGLANNASTILEQSGAQSVRVEHLDETRSTSVVLVSDEHLAECDSIIRLAQYIFPAKTHVETVNSDQLISRYRAKVVLLLGTDVAEYYSK